MPKPISSVRFSSSLLKHTLLSNPTRVAMSAWFALTVALIIPASINLAPLGREHREARGELDEADEDVSASETELDRLNAAIDEAFKRVVDLGCAMEGYLAFNDGVATLQRCIADADTDDADALSRYWGLTFIADKQEQVVSRRRKTYEETERICQDVEYCYDDGYCEVFEECTDVTREYTYTEVTTIRELFENILRGGEFQLPSLDCGFYSRAFQIDAPLTQQISESSPRRSGRKEDGQVDIRYNRFFGPKLPMSYQLDESEVKRVVTLPIETSRPVAARTIAVSLFQFLTTSLAAFQSTGEGYPALRERINQSIPVLEDAVSVVNATLQTQLPVQAAAQARFDVADDEFNAGLSLWLPLLFIVPGAFALLTYVLLSRQQANPRSGLNEADALELGRVRSDSEVIHIGEPPIPPGNDASGGFGYAQH